MSQPPSASSQQRSASAGNYPSSSISDVPFTSTSATTTPLLGQGSLHTASPAPSLLPSTPLAGGHTSTFASPASASFAQSSSGAQSTSSFRRLVWEGTIPICVTLDSAELPAGADTSVDSTYLVVPRVSYLPLIVGEVKRNLLELVLEAPALAELNDKEIWFEYEGQPLRWHWQIGLLYDYHTSNSARTSVQCSAPTAASSGLGSLRADNTPANHASSSGPGGAPALPWHIKLRLGKPPVERLHSNAGLESCKTSFMSMIKEADFVRYGSTKKVTNLRKQEQDSLWEGVVGHDYELFWSIANKLIPMTPLVGSYDGTSGQATAGRSPMASRAMSLNLGGGGEEGRSAVPTQRSITSQPNESQASLAPSLASTVTSTTSSDPPLAPSASGVRSVPVKIFLPDNAPIVQEPVPPVLEDGRANTLGAVLSALFPLLFPPTPSFSSFQAAPKALACAVVQGIRVPLDAEIGWLGSSLVGADGWVAVVIGLVG